MFRRKHAVVLLFIPCIIIVAGSLLWNGSKSMPYPGNTLNAAFHQKPNFTTTNALVQYALQKINNDRMKVNLPSLQLSHNNAAQVQSEGQFKIKYQHPTHWINNGMKPYMLYSVYGGRGYVEQNVAIRGYDNTTIDKCKNKVFRCVKLNPYSEIDNAEWKMIYNDTVCCKNAHRNNILDTSHTNVSIGISYDRYYFAFVQNFENNYIEFNKPITQDNRHIEISGVKLKNGTIDNIGVYYDEVPSHLTYQENKNKDSYGLGMVLASAVKPLPPFFHYKVPSNSTLMEADKWFQNAQSVDISFDLSPILKKSGVYTIVAYFVDSGKNKFPVTSSSIFIK